MNRVGRNNGIYAAETILKQRTKDGKVWYLMKWKGYSPRFNTWEPEENVLDDRLLKAYRKRVSESKGKVRRKRSKPTEGEGNPSEDKVEDVDIEGVDSSNEAAPDDQESRDAIPSTSAEQPVVDSPRKWRKRRKLINNSDTPSAAPTENDQENVQAKEVEQGDAPDISMETVQDEDTTTSPAEVAIEPEMKELSVEIPEQEEEVAKVSKSTSTSPAQVEPAISPQIIKSLDTPSSTSSSAAAVSGCPLSGLNVVEESASPPPVSPVATDIKAVSPREELKPDIKPVQPPPPPPPPQDKKSILSKSSHFDFLANSIIITDVTTERGTVTVKECSAYGDFFGPELERPQ